MKKKNIRYALSGIAKEMFYSKKSFIVRSEKNAYVFFILSKDRVDNFNSLRISNSGCRIIITENSLR